MSRTVRFAPLALLLLVVGALVWRLATPADREIGSKLVGRPLPDAQLGPMTPDAPPIPLRSLVGKPMVINFFASWCVPCIGEAPLLGEMKQSGAQIVGIAVRDRSDDVAQFLAAHGNPYQAIGADPESRIQIALGSSGVPESFVVDGRGVIRYQHIGPIEASDVPIILQQLEQAQ
jgi:cytochrome c biogenesis protein CcmG/thiol:disulfide interchange protein DsbE